MIKTVSKKTKLHGEITIPADKSVSHRAVILASIANSVCNISNFSSGADCQSTVNIMKQLGIEITHLNEKTLSIKGSKLSHPLTFLNCGNSGTTMRLLSGILARQSFNSVLVGDPSLTKRPMKRIIEPLSLMGAQIISEDYHAPLQITGTTLHGINYESKISSAQVKSCVLLAGLEANGVTQYSEPFISRNHTEIMLKYFGANINTQKCTTVLHPSELVAKDIEIIGDISSAAFFIVAGLITEGSDFIIKNVGTNPTRTGILDIIKRMGGNIELLNQRVTSGEECADIRVIYTDNLIGCNIDKEDIPRLIDELPIIAVLASQAEGKTTVKNAEDLRNKEADRISCLVKELRKIGVSIEELPDGFEITGKTKLTGDAELEVYNDHRLAMSFYVAGLVCQKEILIKDFEWTNISFPEFEQLIEALN